MVREAGLEPARAYCTLEPESSESANSTTRAFQSCHAALSDCLLIIAAIAPVVNHYFTFLEKFSHSSTSASTRPMSTPITDAIINPLVHPLESPKQ